MIKRALQDITNVKNTHIHVSIKKDRAEEAKRALQRYSEHVAPFCTGLDRAPGIGAGSDLSGYSGEISLEMRKTLVEWMYDVKIDFSLSTLTYQTAVRALDIHIAKKGSSKKMFQLVGCTALFTAQKFTECKKIKSLEIFVDVCDNAYTKERFIEMEREILRSLDFSLIFLLPTHLIRKSSSLLEASLQTYASEVILTEISYCLKKPSDLAVYIEDNVSCLIDSGLAATPDALSLSIFTRGTPGQYKKYGSFVKHLKSSASILEQQSKSVREFVSKLNTE